jgi:hypothetical protein
MRLPDALMEVIMVRQIVIDTGTLPREYWDVKSLINLEDLMKW